MLVRKYIHKRLSKYYQQPSDVVVGSVFPKDGLFASKNDSIMSKYIQFLGDWHWRYHYAKQYKIQSGQWLTPVELFRPYYSQTIGNYIISEIRNFNKLNDPPSQLSNRTKSSKVQIFELGGGRGTNSKCILDYLKSTHRDIYDQVESYTILDSSPTLLDMQKKTLVDGIDDDDSHIDKVELTQVDMMDVAEDRVSAWTKSNTKTIVLALELIDNLPHDKIKPDEETGEVLQAELNTIIDEKKAAFGNNLTEQFYPINDSLLQDIVRTTPLYVPSYYGQARWVPTVCCGLIHQLFDKRPNSSLLLADFDWLPSPNLEPRKSILERKSIEAEGEPIITDMKDIDHACYITAPPLCDILFPTNFDMLSEFTNETIKKLAKKDVGRYNHQQDHAPGTVHVWRQHEFLLRYGENEVSATKSVTGYTPLLEDFSNCSILTVSAS